MIGSIWSRDRHDRGNAAVPSGELSEPGGKRANRPQILSGIEAKPSSSKVSDNLSQINQRMKVVENYIWFPAVHENSLVLNFEMPALQLFFFWLQYLQDFSQ